MIIKLSKRPEGNITPMGNNLLNVSGFSHNQNESSNFTTRSKSFANNVIHKLKRRVSFRGGNTSRPSFHIRSNPNLSIYRVSEASNESPDKNPSSSKKQWRPEDNRTEHLGESGVFSRGRFSASFYFHANKLSVWQSNIQD